MTGTPGFLEFFILEASDYVEQLDGLLLTGGAGGPDADGMQRAARALRGAATMAKLAPFAEVAAGLERVARAMRDGALAWDPAIGGALVAAIDDLKILLRAARAWSPADDQRASTRSAELNRLAPQRAQTAPASGVAGPDAYFATEAANIAAGLELMATRPADGDTASNVLRRVRALRGVAGIKEQAALAETLEATEDASGALERGEPLSAEAVRLLAACAAYLRAQSHALRGGTAPAASERDTFAAAYADFAARQSERERVVPIEELFYSDGASGVVESSASPPTTVAQRFRLELVSLGEHLRQVIAAARAAHDEGSRTRAQRDLRRALNALESAALSFREPRIAELARAHANEADPANFFGLTSLATLADAATHPDNGHLDRLAESLVDDRRMADTLATGFADDGPAESTLMAGLAAASSTVARAAPAPAPVSVAAPPPPRAPAPPAELPLTPVISAPALHAPRVTAPRTTAARTPADLIDASIAALDTLSSEPFAAPSSIPEDAVVPIDTLLYRGRSALDRAVEIRDELRRAGQSDQSALDELFDLLELARAE